MVFATTCSKCRVMITRHGGRCTAAVSSKTDVLVCDTNRRPSGVPILTIHGISGLETFIASRCLTPSQQAMVGTLAKQYSTTIPMEDAERIARLPQHLDDGEANPEWLHSRKNKITGSMVGAILGMNKYCSPQKCLANLLCPSFTGNVCTVYGNTHEDDAQDSTLSYLRMTEPRALIQNCGLMVCTKKDMGWCGQSPDGLFGKYLVEYKCPYGQRGRVEVPGQPVDLYPRSVIPHAASLGGHAVAIPPYYFAQVQWGANLGDFERILFVVWAPAGRRAVVLPFRGEAEGCAVQEKAVGEPRVIHETRVQTTPTQYIIERLVSTRHGLIQVTDLPCDTTWFDWALPRVRDFFTLRYIPALVQTQNETKKTLQANNTIVDGDEPSLGKCLPTKTLDNTEQVMAPREDHDVHLVVGQVRPTDQRVVREEGRVQVEV